MAKQDLYESSPIRAFDVVTKGGLKGGELGLVTAKKGLGKTSVLVQFGMDTLLNGQQLAHVSFDQKSPNVISWYDGIYTEISKKKSIPNEADVKDQIVRNRTILNFNQDNVNLEKVIYTLNALKVAGIEVAGVVVDGVDFKKVSEEDIQAVQNYAKVTKTKVWFSATVEGDSLEDSAPKEILSYFTAVVHLQARNSITQLEILKFGSEKNIPSNLKLDSKTLLITTNK